MLKNVLEILSGLEILRRESWLLLPGKRYVRIFMKVVLELDLYQL